jgi:hypothetical protein
MAVQLMLLQLAAAAADDSARTLRCELDKLSHPEKGHVLDVVVA